jgi:hypothetical protein
MEKRKHMGRKWLVTISYLIMVAANAAAVLLPVNGVTTQEVSDYYANLFAPAGFTFMIWSVIYVLLAAFVIYQWVVRDRYSILRDQKTNNKISTAFIISSLCNGAWLIAWQYFKVDLSVAIMLVLLVSLIYVNHLLTSIHSGKDYWLIRLPFSIYFSWITVATIADITSSIVEKKISLFNDHQQIWTIIIVLVGLLIICATTLKNNNTAYGLTALWSYSGILVKHTSASGWNGEYPWIIYTTVLCLVVIAAVSIYNLVRNMRRRA